ncbi:MAG: ATP-binding protein [Roseburia sp.]|nr:ATP-binding protein [Roseburia sp.]
MNSYKRAVREITDRRRADVNAAHEAWHSALRADDGLYAAFTAYQSEAIKSAKGEPNTLDAAKAALKKEAARLGFSQADLEPPYRCKECHDTGYANGKYCRCVIRSVINSDKQNLMLQHTDFAAAATTAPAEISAAYKTAKKLTDGFPTPEKPFLILAGQSGTGKTVLAAAVATALMERGAATVTVGAFDFLRRALDYHTQFSIEDYTDRFTPMLDCDALVIDDLGTETMLKNVTREYLYAVVNERWQHRKITVITTNLTPDALLARYGESIASRLFDKNTSACFYISAKNERLG